MSCVFCVRANTFFVLCVPPVRNVHKSEYRLIITEQLTIPTSKPIVTHIFCSCQHLYVFSVMIACSTGPYPRRQGQVSSSSNRLLRAQSLYAALCFLSVKPLFYLTTICRQFLFAHSAYYHNDTLTAAHSCGGLAAENDKR